MKFSEKLNGYIRRLSCTAKELSEASQLSSAAISRLRSGSRLPDGKDLERLVGGILAVAARKGVRGLSAEEVRSDLSEASDLFLLDAELFRGNLNRLLEALSVSVSDLARALNYDTSYLSRVRSGQRTPADLRGFSAEVAKYAAGRFTGEPQRLTVAQLIGVSPKDLSDDAAYYRLLLKWLTGDGRSGANSVMAFLETLDRFDQEGYLKAIRYGEWKVPTVPFSFPTTKRYYGTEEMKKGVLDFLKVTAFSKSEEPAILYNGIPLEESGEDDFRKKYQFGLAVLVKKGLQLRMIHDVGHPFSELMQSLSGYIPFYMSGQLTPYWLENGGAFCRSLQVSGAAAIAGECVADGVSHGMACLTKGREELSFYGMQAEDLLKKSRPLMEILRAEEREQFFAAAAAGTGAFRCRLSGLPLYTASEALLRRMLESRRIPEEEGRAVLARAARQREQAEAFLKRGTALVEVPQLSEEAFSESSVGIEGLSKEAFYRFEEYREHLHETLEFIGLHENCGLKETEAPVFRSLDLWICPGEWAVIAKKGRETVSFLTRYPPLLRSLEEQLGFLSEEGKSPPDRP